MTTLSITVMAHVERIEAAEDIARTLNAAIAIDDGSLGETRNGDCAWTLHDPEADWHIVLQDDAQPIPDFRHHATQALTHAPRTAVSFYVGTGRPRQPQVSAAVAEAERLGSAWLEHITLLWGVAVAMPTRDIADYLDWAKTSKAAYDTRIGTYWRQQHIPVRYTFPSLVDHADGPTLIRHPWGAPTAPRKAWRTGTPATWDTPPVRL